MPTQNVHHQDEYALQDRHVLWRNSTMPQGLPLQIYTSPRERLTLVDWSMQSFIMSKTLNQALPKSLYSLTNSTSAWNTTRGIQNVVPRPYEHVWPRLFYPFQTSLGMRHRLCKFNDEYTHSSQNFSIPTTSAVLLNRRNSDSDIPPVAKAKKHQGTTEPRPFTMPRSFSMLSPLNTSILNMRSLMHSRYLSESSSPQYLPVKTEAREPFLTNVQASINRGNWFPFSRHQSDDGNGSEKPLSFEESRQMLQKRKVVANQRLQNDAIQRVAESFDRPSMERQSNTFSKFDKEATSFNIQHTLQLDTSFQRAWSNPDVPRFHFAAYHNVPYVEAMLSYIPHKGTSRTKVLDPLHNKFDMNKATEVDMAATTIQAAFRAYRAKKKRFLVSQLVCFFKDANEAATVIQKNWHRLKAQRELQKRKYLLRMMKVRTRAALSLQRAYRQKKAREYQLIAAAAKAHVLARHVSAVVIQKAWRGYADRKKIQADNEMFTLRWPFDSQDRIVEVVGTFTSPAWKWRSFMHWDCREGLYLVRLPRRPGSYEIQFIVDGRIVIHGGLPIIEENSPILQRVPSWSRGLKVGDPPRRVPGRGMRNTFEITAHNVPYDALIRCRAYLANTSTTEFVNLVESMFNRDLLHNPLSTLTFSEEDTCDDSIKSVKSGYKASSCESDTSHSYKDVKRDTLNWLESMEHFEKLIHNEDDHQFKCRPHWYRRGLFDAAKSTLLVQTGHDHVVKEAMASPYNAVAMLRQYLLDSSNELDLPPNSKQIYAEGIVKRVFNHSRFDIPNQLCDRLMKEWRLSFMTEQFLPVPAEDYDLFSDFSFGRSPSE